MNLLKPLDAIIDRITMYRLMIYYLVFLLLVAVGLSLFGELRFSWWSITISASILVSVCWGFNKIFGWLFRAPLNNESSLITAGILALIISPDMSRLGLLFLLAVSVIAMASKYVIAINRKHVFNPAAVAVLLTSLAANQTPSWWVGSAVMLPWVVGGGLVVLRKIRRTPMIAVYLATTSVATAGLSFITGGDPVQSLRNMALSSAVIFIGFVMLPEPLTSPPTRGRQLLYGGLVGALLPPQIHVLGFYASPELALVVGNLFAYVASPKSKLFPVLKQKKRIAANTAEFVFHIDKPLIYQPGQYVELTLPHPHKDARGERRYFTLASSPTENELRFGVKFYKPGSSYKQAMLKMNKQTRCAVGQLAGDFTLPKDRTRKLVFIAGGIGITPFRSMVKYLIDIQEQRDIVLLYGAHATQDVAYRSLFEMAQLAIRLKTKYVLGGRRIDAELIAREIPDYRERLFYVSGTHAMVESVKRQLRTLGVPHYHIKTDFFPGYA